MLATADYYNCLYFWIALSRLPQANPYNPAAWLWEAGSGTALPQRGRGAQGLHGGHGHPQSVLQECEVPEWVTGRTEQTARTPRACFPPYAAAHGWAGSGEEATPVVCGGFYVS